MTKLNPLGFESCAETVAKHLKQSKEEALRSACGFQRNLAWDAGKLMLRAIELNKEAKSQNDY